MANNARLNTFFSLLLQFITAITGLILPQLFIRTYGSDINGVVTSITQFISYLSLVEAGIGAASIAALYKPLDQNNSSLVNKILSTTKKFYQKSGITFIFLILFLIVFYPLMTKNQIDPLTTIWMILILSMSALCDYFILGKYRVLLTADQHFYIINFYQILGTIINLIVTIILIYLNFDIITVKAVSTIVYICRAYFVIRYVKKKYKYLDFNVDTDKSLISQRWDALMHQVAGLIVVNSGIVLLTLFGYDFKEISVFTIYNMIIQVLNNLLMSFYSALTPTFGNIIAKNNQNKLDKFYSYYEFLFFILLFSVSLTYLFLILPFMSLYTQGISDAQYIRLDYAVAGAGVILAFNLYDPSMTLINGSGHYRQTRNYSIICAIINVVTSLFSIALFGPVGVFIAEICSQLFIDFAFIIYNSKKIVHNSLRRTVKRLLINFTLFFVILFVYINYININITNFIVWTIFGFVFSLSFILVYCLCNLVFDISLFKSFIKIIKAKYIK